MGFCRFQHPGSYRDGQFTNPYVPWVFLADPSFITSTPYTFPCQLLTTALLETVVGGKLL